jgi:putative ABC transport system permease protein
VAGSLGRERLLATLSGFFGGLALVLSLIGLYGTMAYNVTRRRKEIGIRAALGASRTHLLHMVLGEAGRMIVTGIVIGGIGIFATTRLVESFLYGRTPLDPMTMVLTVGSVACVALLAAAVPATRAARQNPQAVLREE